MDSYSVGVSHKSATKNIRDDITSKVSKVLSGYCSICNIKKTMTVFGNNVVSSRSSRIRLKRVLMCNKDGKKYIKVPKASLRHYSKRC